MHRNSQLIFTEHILPLFQDNQFVLEVGPGRHAWYGETVLRQCPNSKWHVTDPRDIKASHPHARAAVMPDEDTIPCGSEMFDVVFSAQVMEHVSRPWRWVPELARTLKKDGLLIIVAPVTYAEHRAPRDCWRVLPQGGEVLLKDAGCEVLRAEFMQLDDTGIDEHKGFNPGPLIDLLLIGKKTMRGGAAGSSEGP